MGDGGKEEFLLTLPLALSSPLLTLHLVRLEKRIFQ